MAAEALIDLSGKVFVVTGGNGGIGLGIARGVARAGGSVAIWARRPKESADAVAELESLGARAVAYPCDVADEERVDACMQETLADFGRLDGLVANAGVSSPQRFVDMPTDVWRRVLAVNLDGAFYCLRAAARRLVEQGDGGALVGVSSTSAIHGAPGQEHYAASKAAMEAVMRSLAVELARYRVRANSLLPGWTITELTAPGRQNEKFVANTTYRTPVRRWATPDEFEVIGAFLCDPSLTFHTGASMVVDGGYTVF
jgi:NAD(P)-dependent dehydrogenase (short-subunit alcohol dehydrogenase family)